MLIPTMRPPGLAVSAPSLPSELRLWFDGTSLADKSSYGNSVTPTGDASLSGAQTLYAATAIALDGTGDFISIADTANIAFGSSDFTIRARWRKVSGGGVVFGRFGDGSAGTREIQLVHGGSDVVRANASYDGASNDEAENGGTFASGADVEAAFVNDSGNIAIYTGTPGGTITRGGTGTLSSPIFDTGNPLYVGSSNGSDSFPSYIYELQVWIGTALYSGASYTSTGALWGAE